MNNLPGTNEAGMVNTGFHSVGGAAARLAALMPSVGGNVEVFDNPFHQGLDHLVNMRPSSYYSKLDSQRRHSDAVDKAARRRKQRARRTAQQMARRRA